MPPVRIPRDLTFVPVKLDLLEMVKRVPVRQWWKNKELTKLSYRIQLTDNISIFSQMWTNVMLLLTYVTSMPSVRTLPGLIVAPAKLDLQEMVGRAEVRLF
jgi:hypothetical protein